MTSLLLKSYYVDGQPPEQRPDGSLVLRQPRWILTGPAEPMRAAIEALPGVARPLTPEVAELDFGNSVGIIYVPHLGQVNITSGKWSERDFDEMLADISEVAAGLPYSSSNLTSLPYERSVASQQDVLYHMFVFLRHSLSPHVPQEHQLLPALRQILHDPHQRFTTTRRIVPLAVAQHVDPATLHFIASGAGGLHAATAAVSSRMPLARHLKGRMPDTVNEREIEHTVDTPENRFVKMVLETAVDIIGQMRAVMNTRRGSAFTQRIVADCTWMEHALQPFVRHELWRQVGRLTHVPASSTTLHGRRGYRDVYFHAIKLRLATRLPLDTNKMRDLLEIKDIALLYELWCYFTLVRVLTSILGNPNHADRPRVNTTELSVPHELIVSWPAGVRLLYNPRYSRSRSGRRTSYSVPLRPDIGLEIIGPTGQELHLFDAKFKLDRLDVLLSEDEESIEPERRGTFTREDLYKMHTYRDAIVAARSVWILYPGTEARFFHIEHSTSIWTGVDVLPDTFAGVGGVALVPGASDYTMLCRILEAILMRARISPVNR